jgi:hypothetical protein
MLQVLLAVSLLYLNNKMGCVNSRQDLTCSFGNEVDIFNLGRYSYELYLYDCLTGKSKTADITIKYKLLMPIKIIFDNNANAHFHDESEGTVTVRCEHGHISKVTLINKCTCGWTSVGGQS